MVESHNVTHFILHCAKYVQDRLRRGKASRRADGFPVRFCHENTFCGELSAAATLLTLLDSPDSLMIRYTAALLDGARTEKERTSNGDTGRKGGPRYGTPK